MENNWILKEYELPNAYEEVEILMDNGDIHSDMIIRAEDNTLEWRDSDNENIKAWRRIS